MDAPLKAEIGKRLRAKRESAGYTRERFGELCSLTPRFIANIELGDSSLSLDTLITFCRVLSCSSDDLLFGSAIDPDAWADTVNRVSHLDIKYKESFDQILKGVIEVIAATNKETENFDGDMRDGET